MTAPLRGFARPLGPAFDLIATYSGGGDLFFERGGLGASTSGVAQTIRGTLPELVDRTPAALAGIEMTGGVGPIAVGALAFDPKAESELFIPAHATVRVVEGAWALDIVRAAAPPPRTSAPSRWMGRAVPHAPFGDLQLVERPSAASYAGLVEAARARIRAGAIDKVVLARTLEVNAGRTLDPKELLWRLRAVEPDGYAFAAPSNGGVLVGASPELLAEVTGGRVRVTPLAGSAPRHGDPLADRESAEVLLASEKDRHEHAIVVAAVAAALSPLCEELDYPLEPTLRATANVWHLATRFSGRLRAGVPGVLSVVGALHPTPAVGGHPTAAALDALGNLEPFDRGSYAGPVGWVDANGDGVWAVALRCAELVGERARLFAGAGIVSESDPSAEVEETQRKFRAFLDALRWG